MLIGSATGTSSSVMNLLNNTKTDTDNNNNNNNRGIITVAVLNAQQKNAKSTARKVN